MRGKSRICVTALLPPPLLALPPPPTPPPRVINIRPGGYVVDLIGWRGLARRQAAASGGNQLGAEPCMKPLYCLGLPVLPERRGQLLFTRSRVRGSSSKRARVSSSAPPLHPSILSGRKFTGQISPPSAKNEKRAAASGRGVKSRGAAAFKTHHSNI